MKLQELVEAERAAPSPEVEDRKTPSYANASAASHRQPQHVQTDDRHAVNCYANSFRVTATPEELILDFGLDCEHSGVPSARVDVAQRLVVNYFTAKRMYRALQHAVQRHEQAFGVLEVDVSKRIAHRRRETAGPTLSA